MYARFIYLLAAIPLATLVGAHNVGFPSRRDTAHRRANKTYKVQDWYQGNNFFSTWTFDVGPDPTNGNVNYVSIQDAKAQGLAYVNGNNSLVLAVDSTSSVPAGGRRNSVRITSNNNYNGGLFIMDAAAMPVGCGTWPSFWTVGPNWPYSGEIDIVEGINDQALNQMTLHSGTSQACMIDTSIKGAFTGHTLNPNCTSTATADAGCSIQDPSATSFAYGFNNAQGGVFAMLWDASAGISMWHFARTNIPVDITNRTPAPANWGTPNGFWSAKTCNISANFFQHTMVFDTTICGGWAGPAYDKSGCPGTCAAMVANATNFVNAKWVINYVAVYQ